MKIKQGRPVSLELQPPKRVFVGIATQVGRSGVGSLALKRNFIDYSRALLLKRFLSFKVVNAKALIT